MNGICPHWLAVRGPRRSTRRTGRAGRHAKDDPAQVAKQGFDALMGGKDKIVAGSAKTKAQGAANTELPDKLKAAAHRQMAEPGSGE